MTDTPVEAVRSAQGKDFSNHNGALSASSLNGLQFAIFKATEGTGFTDVDFASSWALGKKVGIHRGAYHFFHPAIDPVAQAKFFVNTVKARGLEPGDILAADVEITSGAVRRLFNIDHKAGSGRNDLDVAPASASLVNSSARKFLDTVKSLVPSSNPIIVYSNLSVGSQLTLCTAYPLWVAFPSSSSPSNVSPWKHWTFWQWGMTGVDRDAFNGTATDLQNWINTFVTPTPSGPFRHTLTTDTSVLDIAHSRQETVHGFFSRQVDMSDADAAKTILKTGSVYLTIHP